VNAEVTQDHYFIRQLKFVTSRCNSAACVWIFIVRIYVQVKQSRYRPELALRDLGTRRGVWSASRPSHCTPGKDPVPIYRRLKFYLSPVHMRFLSDKVVKDKDHPITGRLGPGGAVVVYFYSFSTSALGGVG
jgi:hypothetical protein